MRLCIFITAAALLCPVAASAQASDCITLAAGSYQLQSAPSTGVQRLTDNAVIPQSADNRDWTCYHAWLAAGNTPLPAPAAPVITSISKSAFLKRFTPTELTGISAAARQNDTVNVWLITAQAYDQIDLSDPLTKQGLDALVTAGLLTGDREMVILTP